jgi:CO/xanthine dehydrogenase Mo-binding subunit
VYTNNIPCGAFRGFGGPQGLFAAEQQMNKLAEKLEMDVGAAVMKDRSFRRHAAAARRLHAPGGRAAALAGGWKHTDNTWQRPHPPSCALKNKRYGIGYACGFKNVGFSFGAPEQCTAKVELHGDTEIDEAIVYHSGADCGQGAHTVFAQMAAEALDLPLEKIRLVVSDTAYTANSGSASASRMTFMAGNSILGAAELALKKWRDEERPAGRIVSAAQDHAL